MPSRKRKPTPKTKKPEPLRILRYEGHERSGQLEVHVLNRPSHVPEDAFVFVTWIDLPGENKQRSQRWAGWKEMVREDFARCAMLQNLPWMPLPHPKVHIESWVGAKGDKINNRYKYIVDMLPPKREVFRVAQSGKATLARFGLLGLITDDRILDPEKNFTVHENVSRAPHYCSDGVKRYRREVIVYVWNEEVSDEFEMV